VAVQALGVNAMLIFAGCGSSSIFHLGRGTGRRTASHQHWQFPVSFPSFSSELHQQPFLAGA